MSRDRTNPAPRCRRRRWRQWRRWRRCRPGSLLLSYVVGAAMIIDLPERQSLLAAPDALSRLRLERSLLVREAAMFRATTSRPAPDFVYEQFSQN
jgi:hypothetical protein